MSWKTNLIEFGVILCVGVIIAGIIFYSIEETTINSDMKIFVPWIGFFIIPLIYYGLIKVNVNIGRK
jgi:hypothetical protein